MGLFDFFTTKGAMMGSYNGIKNLHPGMPESFYMKEALKMRYRSWSEYQLSEFVEGCDNIDDLIEKIKLFEGSTI